MTAYDRLSARFARIATVGEASSVLSWDASAMMPPGGARARGEQLAVLAGVGHAMMSEPAVADELAAAEAVGEEEPWRARNLALMRQVHTRATALPAALVEAREKAASACETVWRAARPAGDFNAVLPPLTELLALAREEARALGAALDLSPYDALCDYRQPGAREAAIEPVFDAYEVFLRDALPRIEARQAALGAPARPQGPFPEPAQEALCRRLSAKAGLDYAHARLDRSAHPFCGGTPTDIRITTRYDDDYARSLMGVMHETGHALYESGLPEAWRRQPVGLAAGMAAHESQSLIVEMQACRSEPYLRFLGPALAEAFGPDPAYGLENLVRLNRHVARSLIRVDADEVTYPAHVILRFRLERAMIAGNLDARDLPVAWNEGMRALLGVNVPDDRRGCLQDIHWYTGLFGYFPSYTLGAMAAAQLMAAARRALPEVDAALARGDLSSLVGWLRKEVHGRGRLFGFDDLLRAATGKPLDPSDFIAHLTARYLEEAERPAGRVDSAAARP